MKHFDALLDEADRTGFPERFVTDLDVDRRVLAALPEDAPFGWALRPWGTHIFVPGDRDGAGHTVDQYPGFVADTFGDSEPITFYWWDGQKLRRTNQRQLAAKLRAASARLGRPRRRG